MPGLEPEPLGQKDKVRGAVLGVRLDPISSGASSNVSHKLNPGYVTDGFQMLGTHFTEKC